MVSNDAWFNLLMKITEHDKNYIEKLCKEFDSINLKSHKSKFAE